MNVQSPTPPTAEPTTEAAPVEPAWSLAEPVEEESSVAAAEGAKEALSSQSETVGSVSTRSTR